jgi:phosphinothricin acetyltransferase
MSLAIRDATGGDIAAVHAIYAHHVLNGFGTFDETPPTIADYTEKWRTIAAMRLPFLVATEEQAILGFAYATPFRPRSAYRYALEDSVYIRHDHLGRGVGSALLESLVARCTALGARQLLAVIGDSKNAGSIGLHRKAGFEDAGTLTSIGYKRGRWVDVVLMQRALSEGDGSPPLGPGAWQPL